MSVLKNIFKFREEGSHLEAVKPFLDHLEDLRWTLIKMVLTLALSMVVAFGFSKQLLAIIEAPLDTIAPDLSSSLKVFGVVDSFIITLQLAFYAGIALSFPILVYFLAQFVLPALTKKEKKYVLPAVGISFLLFLLGVVFSYFLILPQTLKFFFEHALSIGLEPYWTARAYFSFVTHLTLAFGMAFELPVVVLTLLLIGLINFDFLNRTRPYAIVILLLLAVVIAPTPDVLTFLSLGAPMVLLYEMCIWMAWGIEKWRKKKSAAEVDSYED